MRRVALLCSILLLVSSCSAERGGSGPRRFEKGSSISYRVDVTQRQTASGLGPRKTRSATGLLDIAEEGAGDGRTTLVVRSAQQKGTEDAGGAAKRVTGRRLTVDPDDGAITRAQTVFSGSREMAPIDIGLLFLLVSPVPPPDVGDSWRRQTSIHFPWSPASRPFRVDHRVTDRHRFVDLDAVTVTTAASANVTFRLPLAVPAPAPSQRSSAGRPASSDTFLVNRLFEALFSDIRNPVQGVVTAIAAIPLVIVAPFLAIGEALARFFGSLFGGGSSAPERPPVPVLDLSGPMRLAMSSKLWKTDGRVLDAKGTGTASLVGRVPSLSGKAAPLSGKTLSLDVSWTFVRTHTSPLPKRPLPAWPAFVAAYLVVAAAVLAEMSRRRAKRLGVRPRPRR